MNTIERFNEHVMQTYGRYDVVMENCGGASAHDENGKEYIDFGSGIGTNSLGYCDEKWADAVCAQVRSVQHTSNYYYTKVQADFAEEYARIYKLGRLTPKEWMIQAVGAAPSIDPILRAVDKLCAESQKQ